MDGESDNASASENGVGKETALRPALSGSWRGARALLAEKKPRPSPRRRALKTRRRELTLSDSPRTPPDESEAKPQRRNRSRRRRIRPPEERQPGNRGDLRHPLRSPSAWLDQTSRPVVCVPPPQQQHFLIKTRS